MNIVIIILLPLIAGAIGWFTNYLAVKMLFNPKEPVNILGYKLQGVFPKRQQQIAEKVGKMVAEELLHFDDIIKEVNTQSTIDSITSKLDRKLDYYFDVTLVEKYPMVSKLVPQKGKDKIKTEILNEVEHLAPDFINSQIKSLEHTLDIEGIIADKVSKLSSEKLEDLLMKMLSTELKFIEWVGAILGFIIGLIQVLITYVIL
ncbi:MAG: DUF445 family protein [Bacteroidetes bacterium]|nr:DUF445 family protein [Bacteroidota bacterium]MCB9225625.1 DUF445 family protein [Chitinophagales bacterium]